ncbi:MAG: nucleotide exchange factor GrpE [Acidobacteriota bacterium]|nr:nucleotide exchange factor GrpE [Acidobacteriota bacterium]
MIDADLFANPEKLLELMSQEAASAERDQKHYREVESILAGFLEVVDHLERLVAYCRDLQAEGVDRAPTKNVQILHRRALQILAGVGVVPIKARGELLDLRLHEVASTVTKPSGKDDIVLDEIMCGYTLNGRLLRRSKVVVSKIDGGDDHESDRH